MGQRLGILVGGGPAPGINGVIHAATIQAIVHGLDVYGIYDGFKHLVRGEMSGRPLTISDVSRIHLLGGSVLRTAGDPTKSEEALRNSVCALADAGIKLLVAIGGDDTAFSVNRVAVPRCRRARRSRQVHVTKTIDNDLPLPDNIPTFGYHTANDLGSRIVDVMEERPPASTGSWWSAWAASRPPCARHRQGVRPNGHRHSEEWRVGGRSCCKKWSISWSRLCCTGWWTTGRTVSRCSREGVAEHLVPEDKARLSRLVDHHGNLRHEEIDFADTWRRDGERPHGPGHRPAAARQGTRIRAALRAAKRIRRRLHASLGRLRSTSFFAGGTNATISLQGGKVAPSWLRR